MSYETEPIERHEELFHMSEAETKQIVGKCSEISEKNGWTSFSVDVPGNNYPVRLSTKLPALIEQARAVGQETATWTFKESQGGENKNKPGTFHTNRYLEKAEVGGQTTVGGNAEQTAAALAKAARETSTASPVPPVDWDAKERRDYRSRAWAQTLGAFQHTISVNNKPEDVFMRLQPFQRKVFTDVCGDFAFPKDESDVPFEEGPGLLSQDESIPF